MTTVDTILYPNGDIKLRSQEPVQILAMELLMSYPGMVFQDVTSEVASIVIHGPYKPTQHLSCTNGDDTNHCALMFPLPDGVAVGPAKVTVAHVQFDKTAQWGFMPDHDCQAEGWDYAVHVKTKILKFPPDSNVTGAKVSAPDFNGDGTVDVMDLLHLLGQEPLDVSDLLLVLGAL